VPLVKRYIHKPVQNDGRSSLEFFRLSDQCSLYCLFAKTFPVTGPRHYYSVSSAANRVRAASPLRAAPASNATKYARIRIEPCGDVFRASSLSPGETRHRHR